MEEAVTFLLPMGKPITLVLAPISVHFWDFPPSITLLHILNTVFWQVFSHQKCKYHPVSLFLLKRITHKPIYFFSPFHNHISQKRCQPSPSTTLNSLQTGFTLHHPSDKCFIQSHWPKTNGHSIRYYWLCLSFGLILCLPWHHFLFLYTFWCSSSTSFMENYFLCLYLGIRVPWGSFPGCLPFNFFSLLLKDLSHSPTLNYS